MPSTTHGGGNATIDTVVPSEIYMLIWQAVRERRLISCVYKGLRRECCPIVLGYTKDGHEAVAAYQVAGETSENKELPGWRCLHLGKLQDVATKLGEWDEGKSHRQSQSCVQFVDVDANIPETLTREEPLPFGHPDLRPPRR